MDSVVALWKAGHDWKDRPSVIAIRGVFSTLGVAGSFAQTVSVLVQHLRILQRRGDIWDYWMG